MRVAVIGTLALSLLGCASGGDIDMVQLPARSFFYELGRIEQQLTVLCAEGKVPQQTCGEMKALGERLKAQTDTGPAKANTTHDIMVILGTLAGAMK